MSPLESFQRIKLRLAMTCPKAYPDWKLEDPQARQRAIEEVAKANRFLSERMRKVDEYIRTEPVSGKGSAGFVRSPRSQDDSGDGSDTE